jgi:hypothetical protein
VQATYLMLAVLMGGGLVFFGIGGDVSGGLFDAFSERGGGGGNADDATKKLIERNEKRLRANPNDTVALKTLVRAEYQLAATQAESSSAGFPAEAKDELRQASRYWERYLDAEKRSPDAAVAQYAVQIYDTGGLNQPKRAQEAAEILAQEQNEFTAYLRVVQYAAQAGDKRTADLAAQKAVDLAPKGQKGEVKQQAEALKKPQGQPQAQG